MCLLLWPACSHDSHLLLCLFLPLPHLHLSLMPPSMTHHLAATWLSTTAQHVWRGDDGMVALGTTVETTFTGFTVAHHLNKPA